jgi:thiol-disulfide isomerase/thioredoxin
MEVSWMSRVFGYLALVIVCGTVLGADDQSSKAKQPSPAEQFQKLEEEYNAAFKEYRTALAATKTPEERRQVLDEKYPPEKFAARYLAIATQYPNDPVALDALIWIGRMTRNGAADGPRAKALAILQAKYLESPKLGPVATSLGFSTDKRSEDLLRGLLEKNPSRDIQGQSALALTMLLKKHRAAVGRREDQAATKRLDQELEALYERMVKDYADVKSGFGGRLVGATAEAELNEIRNLTVGKTAPDIVGEDAEGKKFKLSDYRGKVVLIDFWAGWCVPCMHLVPHALALSKEMEKRPFAVVGVNLDRQPAAQKNVEQKNAITWRSFHDGSQGPICKHWNVHEIPTLYILDHNGVIRHKYVDSPGEKVLDANIEALVKEAEKHNEVSKK